MPTDPHAAQHLLAYARHVVGQAVALAAAHERAEAPPYAPLVGPHLRHVIEHFEAWLGAAGGTELDYDARARDAGPARDPRLARRRLQAIAERLAHWPVVQLSAPLAVHADIGAAGEHRCTSASSAGRELLYATHHAVHHFAVLQPHCTRHGLAIDATFGQAPATVAHQRRAAADASATPTDPQEDTPCLVTPQAA